MQVYLYCHAGHNFQKVYYFPISFRIAIHCFMNTPHVTFIDKFIHFQYVQPGSQHWVSWVWRHSVSPSYMIHEMYLGLASRGRVRTFNCIYYSVAYFHVAKWETQIDHTCIHHYKYFVYNVVAHTTLLFLRSQIWLGMASAGSQLHSESKWLGFRGYFDSEWSGINWGSTQFESK